MIILLSAFCETVLAPVGLNPMRRLVAPSASSSSAHEAMRGMTHFFATPAGDMYTELQLSHPSLGMQMRSSLSASTSFSNIANVKFIEAD